MNVSIPEAAEALEKLLVEERLQIIRGEIAELGHRLAEKERLVSALSESHPEPDVLDRLRQLTEQNQELLKASARGIRSVMNRIKALKNESGELRSYSATGQPVRVGGKDSSLEHKV